MAVELHLPDLPEVPITLGPVRTALPRPRTPWHLRLGTSLSAYLPLLLMALLALFSWWLVKNTPVPGGAAGPAALRHEPDYTMSDFAIERFDARGRMKVRIAGVTMRHFPDTDRIEADGVQIRAIAPDGRVTRATARRAISNGDASEVQLVGDAHVVSESGSGAPVEISGEFLQAYLVTERVHSHLPVRVQQGSLQLRAAGVDYDHGTRKLELMGPVHAEVPPAGSRP